MEAQFVTICHIMPRTHSSRTHEPTQNLNQKKFRSIFFLIRNGSTIFVTISMSHAKDTLITHHEPTQNLPSECLKVQKKFKKKYLSNQKWKLNS